MGADILGPSISCIYAGLCNKIIWCLEGTIKEVITARITQALQMYHT